MKSQTAFDIGRTEALEMGAHQQRTQGRDLEWQPMATAPRDGTPVEIINTYGVAPSYSLCRWTRETAHHDATTGERRIVQAAEPRWVDLHSGGSPFDERSLQWRPYSGDPADYVDPTGGLQNSMAYWRAAAASERGLPLTAFEARTARNLAKSQEAPPTHD